MKKALLLILFCVYSLANFAQDKDKYVGLKVNKYGFIYRSKTNIIKLVTKNKNSLKNISLKSYNSNIVKKNDSIYELTGVYDWLKVECIDVFFYNSKLKTQKKLYSLSFPILEVKEMRAFIDDPQLIIYNVINQKSILENKKIKILQNDTIINNISVTSFCLTFYDYNEFLGLPEGSPVFKRYCSENNELTTDMLEEILEGINYGGFIYIESIIGADEKGNKIPLPPITVQKVENMPWEIRNVSQ